jgi:hypothetical protein
MINKDRVAPGPVTGFDISPSVADHKTRRKIDSVFHGRTQQETRLRFAAFASIPIVVITHVDFLKGQSLEQSCIDRFNDFALLFSSRNVRLVGYADEHESVSLQGLQCRQDITGDFQLIERTRGQRFSFPHYCPIENTVSIKKNRPNLALLHRTDSHLV